MREGDCTAQGTLWTIPPEKRCGRCRRLKSLDKFGIVRGRPRSYCRECHNHGILNPDSRAEKRCGRCRAVKEMKEFGKLGNRRQPYCNQCRSEDNKARRATLKASGMAPVICRRDYLARRKWGKLLKQYGMTKEQYEVMLKSQGGKCAICRRTEREKGTSKWLLHLSVDHCHKTGKVRGLLCRQCNSAIGRLQDDPSIVRRAADYLEGNLTWPQV